MCGLPSVSRSPIGVWRRVTSPRDTMTEARASRTLTLFPLPRAGEGEGEGISRDGANGWNQRPGLSSPGVVAARSADAALIAVVEFGPEETVGDVKGVFLFAPGRLGFDQRDIHFMRAHQTTLVCHREGRKCPDARISPYQPRMNRITAPATVISSTAFAQ